MHVLSMVFNRNFLKLFVALAIPCGMAYFFWYAQQQANIEVENYKKEQKDHPTLDRMVIKNYNMKEIDDTNTIRWQLTANTGELNPNGHDVELTGVSVEFYDKDTKQLKMRLDAPLGHANQQTKYVKLETDGKQLVKANGDGGKSHFQCKQVELTKRNQFLATGGVIIVWPGVAKVSGDTATGSTNMASGPKDFKVVGNTHTEIVVK